VVFRDQCRGHLAPGGGRDVSARTVRRGAAALLDRFGGASPCIGCWLADWRRTHLEDLVGLVALTVLVVAIVSLRRRIRVRRVE
jgi:hypothetical protein